MTPKPKSDFIEFVWVWNKTQGMGTPAHHRRIARWCDARVAAGDHRLLLMAFRGSGKSTLVGLFCAWWLHRNPEARILVLAADHVSAEAINFMARFGRGLICLTLTRAHCERLQLPPMAVRNGTKHST